MKILQVNSVCGVGSTGRIVTDLYRILEKQGHECIIAYGRGKAPVGFKTMKIGSNIDNYIHFAKSRLLDKHGFGSRRATIEFIKQIKKYDPDVIHLHNIHGYYINIEVLFNYLKEANKKVVWTLHDCWSFTGHCSHFEYEDCKRWIYGCKNCKQKKEYPKSIFIDNSTWNYEKKKEIFTSINDMTIVTPSKWLANLVNQSFLNKYEVKVINNGIDLEKFRPIDSSFRKKYNLQGKTIILGVASIWTKKKGFDYFLELSKRMDNKFKIIMVGVTEKQKKRLPKNILAITRTNNIDELVEIYSNSDVFLNATLEDNFPTTNLEALACGRPVITFDTGGSIESIDKKSGVILKNKNISELQNTVEWVNKNINSQDCIKRAKQFDKYNVFNEYIKFLEEG